jgi:hypothetical protein
MTDIFNRAICGLHKALVSNVLTLILMIAAFIFLRWQFAADDRCLWYSTAIQIGIALSLLQINRVFNIIRIRTYLPAFLYLYLLGGNPMYFCELNGSIVALCIVICYFFLFQSFQHPKAEIFSLNISILLIIGSLLWSPALYFFPFFWYGFYRLKSWNRRIIPAAIIGASSVYLCLFALCVYKNDLSAFADFLPDVDQLTAIARPELTLPEWALCGLLLTLYVRAGYSLYGVNISESIRTLYSLQCLYAPTLLMLALFAVQTQMKQFWLLIFYIPGSLLLAYFFSLTNSKLQKWIFVLMLVFILIIRIIQQDII